MSNDLLLFGGSRTYPEVPRTYAGNMCGVRVPGLAAIPGIPDPTLVLSWFYAHYGPVDRALIRRAWKERGDIDVLLSWPDDRSFGLSPAQFLEVCRELANDGFRLCIMGCSKDDDPADVSEIVAGWTAVLPLLRDSSLPFRFCIGWELSLWLSPTQVQQLIDQAVIMLPPPTKLYVHFQQRYMSWTDGGTNAAFWNANINKLTGILLQKLLSENDADFLDWLHDCLERAAGNDGMPRELIDGHGVDLIMLEINAQLQFWGVETEEDGNRLGRLALSAPGVSGPAGTAVVMGSGNGF